MKLVIKTVDRNWKDPKERGFSAISFSISEKPKSEIYLTEDLDYPRSFNYHMIGGEELQDYEIKFLATSVISFLQPGYYLLSCGESWKQKERLRDIFEKSGQLKDTGCLRSLTNKLGETYYYKILKKLK